MGRRLTQISHIKIIIKYWNVGMMEWWNNGKKAQSA
jgi:hypothetical protein